MFRHGNSMICLNSAADAVKFTLDEEDVRANFG